MKIHFLMDLYPINLNIENTVCLVIGGGDVAVRKIDELCSCGARVVVISPMVLPAVKRMADEGKIEWHAREYTKGDLKNAFLVFAATDNREVQKEIEVEAGERNILFNSVDDPDASSFHVPARVRRGNFLLTISTGGGSPALSAKLRKQLDAEYGSEYQQFVDLLGAIRKRIVADGRGAESHKLLFEKLLQLNILTQIRKREWTELEMDLRAILPDELDVKELLEPIQQVNQTDGLSE